MSRRYECGSVVRQMEAVEAAQMALANVLAVAQTAQSFVLLGDPRQLEQPIQEAIRMASECPPLTLAV